jgi:hypothetical protein
MSSPFFIVTRTRFVPNDFNVDHVLFLSGLETDILRCYTISKAVTEMLDEKDLQAIAALINQSENRVMTYIESNVEKKIQLLAEGHKIILDRLPDVDEQGQLKSRVRVLERVVTDLRVELDDLKKAQ